MGWNLFGKAITDVDMCFIRDLAELSVEIMKSTSEVAAITAMRKIIDDKGLFEKLRSFNDYTTVNDCYPNNRRELIDNARTLFSYAEQFGTNTGAGVHCKLREIMNKMRLTNEEKISLVKNYYKNIGLDISVIAPELREDYFKDFWID